MPERDGQPLRLNPTAPSASPQLPAFLARPTKAPVYHGFPLIEETRRDGWVFGTITDYEDPAGSDFGDAFVVAPDGSRAGIVWTMGTFTPHEICPPTPDRWGVYGFATPTPIRSTADFVDFCHSILPELKRLHAATRPRTV